MPFESLVQSLIRLGTVSKPCTYQHRIKTTKRSLPPPFLVVLLLIICILLKFFLIIFLFIAFGFHLLRLVCTLYIVQNASTFAYTLHCMPLLLLMLLLIPNQILSHLGLL